MKTFGSLGAFALHLTNLQRMLHQEAKKALKSAAVRVEKTAQSEFGHYQPAVEHFEKWAELSPETKAERVRLDFSENEPLLRSGKLRDSVSHTIYHSMVQSEAVVGSESDVMVAQELGTIRTPPRPRAVLGPAAAREKEAVLKRFEKAVSMALRRSRR